MSKNLLETMSDNLRDLSREVAVLPDFKEYAKNINELIENINSPLLIMVMGEFSTGKSTFINALVGEAIAKVDANPTTAVITKLSYGVQDRIIVHFKDGSEQEYKAAEFAQLTAEADENANELHERIDYVERTLPIEILKSMSIIDSPGLNSIKAVHEETTRRFMDKADTVLWMFDANKPGSQTEIDALKHLNPRLTPLVLVNKVDAIDEEEGDSVEKIIEGIERRLKNNKLEAQGFIGISARMAFQGKQKGQEKLIKASNIDAFYEAIEEKVLPNREQYKQNSLLDGLARILYNIGGEVKDMRQSNESVKRSDYATYIEAEKGFAVVWDSLEIIADDMLTAIEAGNNGNRRRMNSAMKTFYGVLHHLGLFVDYDNEKAQSYLEEAAVREDEEAKKCLADMLCREKNIEAALVWISNLGYGCPAKILEKVGTLIEEEYRENKNYEQVKSYYEILLPIDKMNAIKKIEKVHFKEDLIKDEVVNINLEDESHKEKDGMGMSIEVMLMKGDEAKNNNDYENAMYWYKEATKHEDASAMNKVGEMYENGYGVEKDTYKAKMWYKKAIKYGCDQAKINIDRIVREDVKEILAKGDDYIRKGNYDNALHWYMEGVKFENAIAMNNVGEMYEKGYGVKKDEYKAKMWYKKASKHGFRQAKLNLDRLENESNEYTVIKIKDASNLGKNNKDNNSKIVMDNDCINSPFEKGMYYYKIDDYDDAFIWFEKAANAGDMYGMYWLGLLYQEGKGIKKDFDEAIKWYKKSAKYGNKAALDKMNMCKRENNKNKGCFITTAVCDKFGRPDDCYELMMFRNFRDEWLYYQPDGRKLINEYYVEAPMIVEKIDAMNNSEEIYNKIWNEYLEPCLRYIEAGDNNKCKKLYIDMVRTLQHKYVN